jgi:hypothetical protein
MALEMRAMRLLFASAVFVIALAHGRVLDGAERIRMTGPPPAEEAVRELMDSIASSCNHRRFTDFMGHFTTRRASAIRGHMESLFIQNDIAMEIMDVIVLSHRDDKIVFGVRYLWNEKPGTRQVIASKVTAVKVAGTWKIDGEKVESKRVEATPGTPTPELVFDFGGAGVVALNPKDDFLPRDIPRLPGGCANGRCGL